MQKTFLFTALLPIIFTIIISLIFFPNIVNCLEQNGVIVELVSSGIKYSTEDYFSSVPFTRKYQVAYSRIYNYNFFFWL